MVTELDLPDAPLDPFPPPKHMLKETGLYTKTMELLCPLTASWAWPLVRTDRRLEEGRRVRVLYLFPHSSHCRVIMDCLHPGHRPGPIMHPFPYSFSWILITIPSCCPSGLELVKAPTSNVTNSRALLNFLSLTHTFTNSPYIKLITTTG